MTTPNMPTTPTTAMSGDTASTAEAGWPIHLTTPMRQANAVLYQQFLGALNSSDYERIGQLIAPNFVDHHPGFEIIGVSAYQAALREARASLRLEAEAEDILQIDDQVVTRVRLRGWHVGTVMGIPPTGRALEWSTIEIWRVSNGQFAERWAQDDLLGLRTQLAGDAENIALVRQVSDAVNARDYDSLDELFSPDFVDHNPAWNVRSVEELKGIIMAAVEAFDFTAHLDQLYAADGSRVVMHITFTGNHVGPFFGRMPTGRQVEWTSTEVYRVAEGRVAERWTQADTAGLMRQIGILLPQ